MELRLILQKRPSIIESRTACGMLENYVVQRPRLGFTEDCSMGSPQVTSGWRAVEFRWRTTNVRVNVYHRYREETVRYMDVIGRSVPIPSDVRKLAVLSAGW